MNIFNIQFQNLTNVSLLRLLLVAGSLLSPVTYCLTAHAAEIKLNPTFEFKEEFNDNVFLTAGNKKKDFITTITPGLALSRSSEYLNIDLLAGFSWHDYARTAGVAATDYQYTGQLTNKITQRDDLGLNVAYIRNTRPDTLSSTTGLPTISGSDTYQYSGNVRRVLSETTSASLLYSFNQEDYDNQASQSRRIHSAGLVYSKEFDKLMPRLKGTFTTNFNRSLYRDSSNDDYTISAGASRSINEQLSINLSAGGQFIHSTFVTPSRASNGSWGTIGSATLNYTAERGFGAFSFAHNFSAASGQVGAVQTTSFALTLGRNLSDKATAQCAAAYNINQADSGQYSSQGVNDRVLNLTADITYKVSKYFDIGFQYAYYTVNYALDDTTVSQNRVMVRATAKYPFTP